MADTATDASAVLSEAFAKDTWTHEDSQAIYKALYQMRGSADKFRAMVEQARQTDPEPSGVAAVKIGIAEYMLGRFEQALETLAAGTDNKDRRWYQGQCCRQLGLYKRAIEEYTRAADRGWPEEDVGIAVATCLALDGQIDEARKAADKLTRYSENSNYHVLLGLIAQAEGDYDAAEDAFGEALDLDPTNAAAAFRLAFLYDMNGDESQAIELYTQCLRTPPVSAHAMMNLAVLYEDAAQWDLAERCLRAVLSVRPDHMRARLFLKDVLSSKNMYYDEEQERRDSARNAVLDIPVTDFELSVRARNCLKKMEIRTLGDLLRITEAELLAYKNFGETSLAEIKAMLSQKGLRLGQDLETKTPAGIPVEAGEPGGVETTVDNEGVLATPITELELSVRSRKALQRLNVATLGELTTKSETEMLACKNFGQTSLNEIKQRLTEYGLSLRSRG